MSRCPPAAALPVDADAPIPLPRSGNGGCVSNTGGTFACTDCVFDKCFTGNVRAARSPSLLARRTALTATDAAPARSQDGGGVYSGGILKLVLPTFTISCSCIGVEPCGTGCRCLGDAAACVGCRVRPVPARGRCKKDVSAGSGPVVDGGFTCGINTGEPPPLTLKTTDWHADHVRSISTPSALGAGVSSAANSKFGIGVYTDTHPVAPYQQQLTDAAALVGEGGFVILYLCSWRRDGRSCMNASTTTVEPGDRAMLLDAYAKKLRVVVRLGYPEVVRDHADAGDDRARYTNLGAAYARVVASLPPPPSAVPLLYVHAGNEFNACNEWRCSSGAAQNMSSATMAAEVAGFYNDLERAMAPLLPKLKHIRYAHGPIANWNNAGTSIIYGIPVVDPFKKYSAVDP